MTSIEHVATLATFGAVWAVLAVGHNLTDHVIGQTDRQAAGKGAPSATDVADGVSPRRGWGACLAHVAQYHLVMVVPVALVWAVLPLELSWPGLVTGFAVSAVTHAFFDRRWPVAGQVAPGALRLEGVRGAEGGRDERHVGFVHFGQQRLSTGLGSSG